jgi:hypothetical protein
MAILNNLLRRILGPMSFPRFQVPLDAVVTQVYQPPPQVKVTSVPNPPNTPPTL